MRIISGKFKGRNFVPIKNLPVRPTTDFAKEALFSILANKRNLNQSVVLDLFAGTGNISVEFASRGCKQIIAVDNNNLCIKSIQKIINEFEILEIYTRQKDVMEMIAKPSKEKFDIIFADPPFDFSIEQYQAIIQNLLTNQWLKEEGILVIEHASALNLTSLTNNNFILETRKYGSVSFSFYFS